MSGRQTITVAELARTLGIGRNAAYSLVREGRIRVIRIGSRIIVPLEAVNEFLGSASQASNES